MLTKHNRFPPTSLLALFRSLGCVCVDDKGHFDCRTAIAYSIIRNCMLRAVVYWPWSKTVSDITYNALQSIQ